MKARRSRRQRRRATVEQREAHALDRTIAFRVAVGVAALVRLAIR